MAKPGKQPQAPTPLRGPTTLELRACVERQPAELPEFVRVHNALGELWRARQAAS